MNSVCTTSYHTSISIYNYHALSLFIAAFSIKYKKNTSKMLHHAALFDSIRLKNVFTNFCSKQIHPAMLYNEFYLKKYNRTNIRTKNIFKTNHCKNII